ncbi:helix-turn-helix domain-containing protein [Streptomyces spiralis]
MNERTAKDWDWGVKKSRSSRTYADGRSVDYTTGTVTMCGVTTAPVGLIALEKQLHPRFLTLAEREKIRDPRAAGQSLRAIGRALGRPASTNKREIDANSGSEVATVAAAVLSAARDALIEENHRRLDSGETPDAVAADAAERAQQAFALVEKGLRSYAVRT